MLRSWCVSCDALLEVEKVGERCSSRRSAQGLTPPPRGLRACKESVPGPTERSRTAPRPLESVRRARRERVPQGSGAPATVSRALCVLAAAQYRCRRGRSAGHLACRAFSGTKLRGPLESADLADRYPEAQDH